MTARTCLRLVNVRTLDHPARRTLDDIRAASSIYVPSGEVRYISHTKDNLVLEIAFAGSSGVLVTGDRKHLLPLTPFRGLVIEPPSVFLTRLSK
jgi:predicted nucleic acid-binding protein